MRPILVALLLPLVAGLVRRGYRGVLSEVKAIHGQCPSSLQQLVSNEAQVCTGRYGSQSASTAAATGPRRIALVLRGESYRSGAGRMDRDISLTPKSKKSQREASVSHMTNVVKPLEACGFTVDIFIQTYVTGSEDDLANFYKEQINGSVFLHAATDHASSSQYTNADLALDFAINQGVNYEGMFVTRSDVVFKKSVPDLPGAEWSKILFAFHEYERGGGVPGSSPQRIPDTVMWFPARYVNCAAQAGFHDHETFRSLARVVAASSLSILDPKPSSHFGFMMPNEFHDSNPMHDRNPLFRLAGRYETTRHLHGPSTPGHPDPPAL